MVQPNPGIERKLNYLVQRDKLSIYKSPGNSGPVLFGVLALLLCLCFLGRLKHVEHRQIAVDSTAWFWHIMGLAWLVLFAVLIWGQ